MFEMLRSEWVWTLILARAEFPQFLANLYCRIGALMDEAICDGEMPVQILNILWDFSVLGIGWGLASNSPLCLTD